MKVFIRETDNPLYVKAFICTDTSQHCSSRTMTPCEYCIKVPPGYDWPLYLKYLRERLMEIPDVL